MAKASPIKTNFTAGELSPRLDGRTDIAKYDNGCEVLENFVVQPQGGAKRRPGTKYIKNSRFTNSNNLETRLLPFVFNTDQSYAIELGHKKASIIYDDGTLINPARRDYDHLDFPQVGKGHFSPISKDFQVYTYESWRHCPQFSPDGFKFFDILFEEILTDTEHHIIVYVHEYDLAGAYNIPSAKFAGMFKCQLQDKKALNLPSFSLLSHCGAFFCNSAQDASRPGLRFVIWDGMSNKNPDTAATNVVDWYMHRFTLESSFSVAKYFNEDEATAPLVTGITGEFTTEVGVDNTGSRYPIPITGLAVLPNFDSKLYLDADNIPVNNMAPTLASDASDGLIARKATPAQVDAIGGFFLLATASHKISPNALTLGSSPARIFPNELLLIPVNYHSNNNHANYSFAQDTLTEFPLVSTTADLRGDTIAFIPTLLKSGSGIRSIIDPHGTDDPARTVVTHLQIRSIRDHWIYNSNGSYLRHTTDGQAFFKPDSIGYDPGDDGLAFESRTIANDETLDGWNVHAKATYVLYISTAHADSTSDQFGEANIYAIPFRFTNDTSLANFDFLDKDSAALSCALTYDERQNSTTYNAYGYQGGSYPGTRHQYLPGAPFISYDGELLVYSNSRISFTETNIASVKHLKYPYYIFSIDDDLMGIDSTTTEYRVDELLSQPSGTTFDFEQTNVLSEQADLLLNTAYEASELKDVKFAQSADVLFLVHPNHPPQSLIRWGANEWSFGPTDLKKGPYVDPPFDDSYIVSNKRGPGLVSLTKSDGWKESDFNRLVKVHDGYAILDVVAPTEGNDIVTARVLPNDRGDELLMPTYTATTISFAEGDPSATGLEHNDRILDSDGRFIEKGFKVGMRVTTTGAANSANNNSGMLIVEVTEDTMLLAPSNDLTSANAGPSVTIAGDLINDEEYRLGAFSDTTGYPANVALYESRLIYSNTTTQPQTIFFSEAGNFQSFRPGIEATDAITYTLSSNQINIIQYMVSSRLLIIGTTGGEFVVSSGALDSVITPTNVQIRRQAAYGSGNVQPVTVGSAVLFVQRGDRKVRELVYNFDTDSYFAPDLTLLAEHITESDIKEIVWQQEPESILWARLGNGRLCAMTYRREEEVIAWHRHQISGDGFVESLCVTPSRTGDDQLFMIVRDRNSSTRRVERLTAFADQQNVSGSVFLDSSIKGVLISQSPVVSGLDHLEGKTVQYLYIDNVDSAVVSNGQISVDSKYATSNNAYSGDIVIGLPYESTLKTMRTDVGGTEGTSQAKTKRIREVTTRFLNTFEAKIGPDENNLKSVPFDEEISQTVFTGDKTVEFQGDYDTDGFVVVKQDKPLPMTVLAIMPLLQTFDR